MKNLMHQMSTAQVARSARQFAAVDRAFTWAPAAGRTRQLGVELGGSAPAYAAIHITKDPHGPEEPSP